MFCTLVCTKYKYNYNRKYHQIEFSYWVSRCHIKGQQIITEDGQADFLFCLEVAITSCSTPIGAHITGLYVRNVQLLRQPRLLHNKASAAHRSVMYRVRQNKISQRENHNIYVEQECICTTFSLFIQYVRISSQVCYNSSVITKHLAQWYIIKANVPYFC